MTIETTGRLDMGSDPIICIIFYCNERIEDE